MYACARKCLLPRDTNATLLNGIFRLTGLHRGRLRVLNIHYLNRYKIFYLLLVFTPGTFTTVHIVKMKTYVPSEDPLAMP